MTPVLPVIEPGLQVSLDPGNLLSRLKTTPGTLQEGGASFATTHWSVVAQSALTDVREAATLLRNYANCTGRQQESSHANERR
jgi:hypothetical protein